MRQSWLGTLVALALSSFAQGEEVGSKVLRIAAIGDAGLPGEKLDSVAGKLRSLYGEDGSGLTALLFLGDNFYETGLSRPDWEQRFEAVFRPFGSLPKGLGPARVHGVAGNHDYYTKRLFWKIPAGFSTQGNQNAASRTDVWSYHWGQPAELILPIEPGVDLQFVFFDSAVLLRQPTSTWDAAFTRLTALLRGGPSAPTRRWRVIVAHHPLYSAGEHGKFGAGWGWIMSKVDAGDLHDGKYRAYRNALRQAVAASGVRVHVFLAGHDHDLQLLWNPERDCPTCPSIHIVSGAGSKLRPVARPDAAAYRFAATTPGDASRQPMSRLGFAELTVDASRFSMAFCGPGSVGPLEMGGGSIFVTRPEGGLELDPADKPRACDGAR